MLYIVIFCLSRWSFQVIGEGATRYLSSVDGVKQDEGSPEPFGILACGIFLP